MKSKTDYLWFNTSQTHEYVNITDRVEEIVRVSGIQEGLVLVSAMHITAGVYVNDAESGLIAEIRAYIPSNLRSLLAAASTQSSW